MINARVAAISTSGQRDQRALRSPMLNTVNAPRLAAAPDVR